MPFAEKWVPILCEKEQRKPLLLVPQKIRALVFKALHENAMAGGHFNWKKTLAKTERTYYWPGISQDIFNWCKACELCQRKLARNENKEKIRTIQTDFIGQRVYIDLCVPFHKSSRQNAYIVCMIDHFSKFAVTSAVPDCKAHTVAHVIVTEYILRYGAMQELVSDNASYLASELITEIGKLLAIDRYFTTPYHHEGSGLVEKMFATLEPMLRTYVTQNILDWDVWLPAITHAYNTSVHTSIGETPFFLMHGRDPSLSLELMLRTHEKRHIPRDTDASLYKAQLLATMHQTWKQVIEYNIAQSEKFKTQADATHKQPLQIEVGDRVFLKDNVPKIGISKKLCLPWQGQYRVIEKNPPHLTVISISTPKSGPKKVHMDQVKKCNAQTGPVFTTPRLEQIEQQNLRKARAMDHVILGYPKSSEKEQPPRANVQTTDMDRNKTTDSQPPPRYNLRSSTRKFSFDHLTGQS